MSQYYGAPPNQGYAPSSAQNLQFYPSSYGAQPVSGHATPSQASYGYAGPSSSAPGYGSPGFGSSFGAPPGAAPGVSGRMGEQSGLRTGWLAALSTEGYDGEPRCWKSSASTFPTSRPRYVLVAPISRQRAAG